MMVMFVLGWLTWPGCAIAGPRLERLIAARFRTGKQKGLLTGGGPYRSLPSQAHEEQVAADEQLDSNQWKSCPVPTEKPAATMAKAEVVMKLVLIEEKLDELIVRAKVGGGVR